MPKTNIDEILADFEHQGDGRVRFLWNRLEARPWLKQALLTVQEQGIQEGREKEAYTIRKLIEDTKYPGNPEPHTDERYHNDAVNKVLSIITPNK